MSMDAFEEHWTEEHVPRVNETPNLKKYTTAVALDPEKSTYDGVAELYFENIDDMNEAMNSEPMEWALSDLETFTDTDRNDQLVFEETVQVDKT